jgi:hypothetical protein
MQTRALFKFFVAGPIVLLALGGCVDPEQSFNDFTARYNAVNGAGGAAGEAGVPDGGGSAGADGGGCVVPAPGALTGTYLFTLSAKLKPTLPVVFTADLSTVAASGGSGSALKLTLQALAYWDRKTPVGSPLDIPPITIEQNGQLDTSNPLPALTVSGDANEITPGGTIVATATLNGQICGVQDFYCGTVTGNVTQPIPIPLKGSTYTFDKITDPNNYPDPPPINCAMDPADPPPPEQ